MPRPQVSTRPSTGFSKLSREEKKTLFDTEYSLDCKQCSNLDLLWLYPGKGGRKNGRGSNIWQCLLTVRLASLKINKFFDDKEPIDSLILSVYVSLSLSYTLFSTALLSFLLSLSFFAAAVSKGARLEGV